MKPTFVAYVDESGDEGFSFGQGSSEWFILTAVVTRKARDVEVVKLVDQVRNQLKKPHKRPLHFRDLKHEQRVPFVSEIAKADLRTVAILIHKPSLKEPETFQERFRLYFYAARYLFERVSWYCRDHKTAHDIGDGSAEIAFSNRSGMSYEEVKEYFNKLEKNTGIFDVHIDWSAIKPDQIAAHSARKRMGLQIADAVASSFFYACEPRYGYTEDRYARILKPIVYHRSGKHLGYGLKFWPREVEDMLKTEDRFSWLRSDYK